MDRKEGERSPAGNMELWGFLLILAGMFGGFAFTPLFGLIVIGFVVFLAGRFER